MCDQYTVYDFWRVNCSWTITRPFLSPWSQMQTLSMSVRMGSELRVPSAGVTGGRGACGHLAHSRSSDSCPSTKAHRLWQLHSGWDCNPDHHADPANTGGLGWVPDFFWHQRLVRWTPPSRPKISEYAAAPLASAVAAQRGNTWYLPPQDTVPWVWSGPWVKGACWCGWDKEGWQDSLQSIWKCLNSIGSTPWPLDTVPCPCVGKAVDKCSQSGGIPDPSRLKSSANTRTHLSQSMREALILMGRLCMCCQGNRNRRDPIHGDNFQNSQWTGKGCGGHLGVSTEVCLKIHV